MMSGSHSFLMSLEGQCIAWPYLHYVVFGLCSFTVRAVQTYSQCRDAEANRIYCSFCRMWYTHWVTEQPHILFPVSYVYMSNRSIHCACMCVITLTAGAGAEFKSWKNRERGESLLNLHLADTDAVYCLRVLHKKCSKAEHVECLKEVLLSVKDLHTVRSCCLSVFLSSLVLQSQVKVHFVKSVFLLLFFCSCRDRDHHLKTFKSVVPASKLVDWLLSQVKSMSITI